MLEKQTFEKRIRKNNSGKRNLVEWRYQKLSRCNRRKNQMCKLFLLRSDVKVEETSLRYEKNL
jgi:hypothetical protein